MKKPIAFDWDGTLYQVHLMAVPAFINVFSRLAAQGLIDSMPSEAKFLSIFGMIYEDIWEYLLPGTSQEFKGQVAQAVIQEEDKIRERGALYPGVFTTLEELKGIGHPLFVVSNGTLEYVQWACASTGLTPLLAGIYTAGGYKTKTKIQLLAHALREHSLEPGIMVGDRGADIEAGLGNGFVSIGCTYGYGTGEEFKGADYIIGDIRELPAIVRKIQQE